jgi:glycosyltransferase involved in cell wall biosynthesis
MGKRDLVSIVTPCYNTGKYVHRLLESVLNQTYPNIEMFVIDDGSSDNSAEIVKSSTCNIFSLSLQHIFPFSQMAILLFVSMFQG